MRKIFNILILVFALIMSVNVCDAATIRINSNSDWASVTADDDVIIEKYQANLSLDRDITCKSLTFNAQEIRLNCNWRTLTVNGNMSINSIYKCATITNIGTINVNGNLSVLGQESKLSGNTINVHGGDINMSGYACEMNVNTVNCTKNDNVGGNLNMSSQNSKITGSVSTDGNILVSGYSAGVQGNIDCDGNLTMTSQNAYITGNATVGGNLTMNGYEARINGNATVSGDVNISNNANVNGTISEPTPQPTSIDVTISGSECTGDFIAVTSEIGVAYQWYKDGVAINGATSSTYDPSDNDESDYYCVVTKNDDISGTSNSITYFGGPKIMSTSTSTLRILNHLHGDINSASATISTRCATTNDIDYDLLHDTNFSVSRSDNTFTVSFTKTEEEIECTDSLILTCNGEIQYISLIGICNNYPKVYTIKKNGADYVLSTDVNGDITLEMEPDGGNTYEVPSDVRIDCRNFVVKTANGITDHCSSSFINKGVINATDDIHLTANGNGSIKFDCNAIYSAKNLGFSGYIANNNENSFKGSFVIENKFYTESNGQGQDLYINECAYITAYEGNFSHSGGSMVMFIDGDLVVERFIQNNTVHVRSGGMFISGQIEMASNLNILGYKGSILSLCYNPTQSYDNIGFCGGTIFYNDGDFEDEHGWGGNSDPLTEGDLNETYIIGSNGHSNNYWGAVNNNNVGSNGEFEATAIAAFHTYRECLDPHNTYAILMGIDDDPFIPKAKEIKFNKVYCEPCDEELEHTKMQIRELGNKWFRYINGELIYCEGDNK